MCYQSPQTLTEMNNAKEAYKVLWYIYVNRLIQLTKYGADLPHAVRAIVEQE
jgi:hypothetical protein